MTERAREPYRTTEDGAAQATLAVTPDVLQALRGAAAHVERTLTRALDPHGITTVQYSALQILHDHDGTPVACSEIRSRLTSLAPDVTRLLDRLEAVGLVARERDTNDRRVVHTRITEKGREVLDRARPDVREAETRALAGLSTPDQSQLSRLLAGVQRNCPGA